MVPAVAAVVGLPALVGVEGPAMPLASAVVAAAAPADGLAECDNVLVVLFGNSANSCAFGLLAFGIFFLDIGDVFLRIF